MMRPHLELDVIEPAMTPAIASPPALGGRARRWACVSSGDVYASHATARERERELIEALGESRTG
ncbi:hypothetical protein GCM10022226_27290 [Sphaerisporangium flaviroseum]|uniref:Uncharacterized protein n=1 Tax=Sphaerisporangium flaviroseum TaxID=509199 RepID=A0ABP7HZ37_9ACTN